MRPLPPDLTTERSFDSQATWAIDVLGLFLTCHSLVFVQPGTLQTFGRLVQGSTICTEVRPNSVVAEISKRRILQNDFDNWYLFNPTSGCSHGLTMITITHHIE